MRHKKDFYEILGVGKQATNEEIKKNYRKVLKKINSIFKVFIAGFEIPSG